MPNNTKVREFVKTRIPPLPIFPAWRFRLTTAKERVKYNIDTEFIMEYGSFKVLMNKEKVVIIEEKG